MDKYNNKKSQSGKPRILIVGGVAGGASCAARARRLSEDARIVIFERGTDVSYATCGLPYYIGNIIPDERDLHIATPQLLKNRFNIEVRIQSDVQSIYRETHELEIKRLDTGEIYREGYDALVLAPGSAPIRPQLPGIDLPGIFTLRTITDSQRIKEWIAARKVTRAIVIGGGLIGLETAENLIKLGISVRIIEMLQQVMPSADPEMVVPLHEHLASNGVSLHLGDGVARFEQANQGKDVQVITESGASYVCDMVLLAIGVRPEIELAKKSGLEIGRLGGIRVDDQMRTSDERIWAVGDAVEVRQFVTGEWSLIPLAGPANRQGRIVADAIFGRGSKFRGTQGTMVCKVFDMTVAATGVNEKALLRSKSNNPKIDFQKIYLHSSHHANYYPGAKPMTLKFIFATKDGKILGAQAVGEEGVDKRIDVISMAIQKGSTVFDLEEAELCYAPQFGAAKDPINIAGMIAANILRGDSSATHWTDIDMSQSFILDVREPHEYSFDHVEGATNIPLGSLRARLDEVPNEKEVQVYCTVGQRSYYASRILRLNGFSANSISGGITTRNSQKQGKNKIIP